MTHKQMAWSGALALILLYIILDLPPIEWRYQIFNTALFVFAYKLGKMKPAIVRIIEYPPKKIDVTDEMRRAMDLSPGRRRL